MALSSESIGTRWRTLPKSATGGAPTRCVGLSAPYELGKTLLDRLVAPPQPVVLGIRDLGRVLAVVQRIVTGDLAREALELARRRGAAQLLDRLGLRQGQAEFGDQARGGGARGFGDLGAGQHARDLLAALRGGERHHGDRGAAAAQRLLDPPMVVGARRDLGGMGHHQHLGGGRDPREALADRIRGGAADAAVDLVEHQARRRALLGEHDLERQHQPRELAARGDARERPGLLAGVGRDLEGDPLGALARPVGFRQRDQAHHEARLVELERRQLRHHRPRELAGRPPARQRRGVARRS